MKNNNSNEHSQRMRETDGVSDDSSVQSDVSFEDKRAPKKYLSPGKVSRKQQNYHVTPAPRPSTTTKALDLDQALDLPSAVHCTIQWTKKPSTWPILHCVLYSTIPYYTMAHSTMAWIGHVLPGTLPAGLLPPVKIEKVGEVYYSGEYSIV